MIVHDLTFIDLASGTFVGHNLDKSDILHLDKLISEHLVGICLCLWEFSWCFYWELFLVYMGVFGCSLLYLVVLDYFLLSCAVKVLLDRKTLVTQRPT